MHKNQMFQTSMLLIFLCFHLNVSEGRYNSNNGEYEISEKGEVSDSGVTLVDVLRGLQFLIGSDPSSRLGLAPRKWPSPDDPSINEIDSPDYFPSIIVNISTTTEKQYHFPSNNISISTSTENNDYIPSNNVNMSTTTEKKDNFPSDNVNISSTTEKPDILWGLFINNSGIFSDPNDRGDIFTIDWSTSTNTTTKESDTELTVPEHPTSLAEFINAQWSLLVPMWTNFFKLTDYFSREIIGTLNDAVSEAWDFLWEIIELFFSEFEFDYSELEFDDSEL